MTSFHPCRTLLLLGTLVSMLALASTASASPVLRHLYGIAAVDDYTARLVPFDVSATGQLTERTSQSVTLVGAPDTIVVGRAGRTLYVGAPDSYDHDDNDVFGSIKVFSVADDGSLSLLQTVNSPADKLALSPDGTRLFVTSNSTVISFPVLGNGSLGAVQANPAVTGPAGAIAIAPDGATLYDSSYPQYVQQYAIASDGTLTARSPSAVGTFGCWSGFLGLTPDGAQLDALCYNKGLTLTLAGHGLAFAGWSFTSLGGTANVEDIRARATYNSVWPNRIQQLKRMPDGSLGAFATTLLSESAGVSTLAGDPSGNTLVVGTNGHLIKTYAINADGSLSPTAITATTTLSSFSLLVYGPDQPPVAALSATQDVRTLHFDAGSSSAVNGTIARYDWTFGDGTTLADGGSTTSHTYAAAGDYVARVTLTDSSGCSVAETYTGLMPICVGSANAAASLAVHVVADVVPPVVTPPIVTEPGTAAPAPTTPPTEQPAQRTPETLVIPRSLTGTPTVGGGRVRLSWTPAPGAPPSKRYLIAWSSLFSAQGPSDPNMRHIWTTKTELVMAGARPGTTLHYAVYAYGSDGRLVKAGKTTIRVR